MEADFAREMTARAHALLQMPAQRGLDLRDGKEDEEMTGGVSCSLCATPCKDNITKTGRISLVWYEHSNFITGGHVVTPLIRSGLHDSTHLWVNKNPYILMLT